MPGGLVCGADFANFGISGAPLAYKSDTVQSFELGAKNNVNHAVQLDTSFYYVKWNNIQQNIVPPICQIQWTQNLGAAVSKGFDVQADFDLGSGWSLETSLGYTDAQYTQNAFVGTQPWVCCPSWPRVMRSRARTAPPSHPGPPPSDPSTHLTPSRISRTCAWTTNTAVARSG